MSFFTYRGFHILSLTPREALSIIWKAEQCLGRSLRRKLMGEIGRSVSARGLSCPPHGKQAVTFIRPLWELFYKNIYLRLTQKIMEIDLNTWHGDDFANFPTTSYPGSKWRVFVCGDQWDWPCHLLAGDYTQCTLQSFKQTYSSLFQWALVTSI